MQEKIQDKKTAVLQPKIERIFEQEFHGAPMSQICQRVNSSTEVRLTCLAQFAFINYKEIHGLE